jgi:hypothetical protein
VLTSRFLLRTALLFTALLLGLSLLLPHSALVHVAQRFTWVGRGDAWLLAVVPGWDLDHFAAFGALGLMAALAGVRASAGGAALWLLGIALLTEALQAWVPGRSPQLRDVLLDVAGGMAGYVVGSVLARLALARALTPALSRERERE